MKTEQVKSEQNNDPNTTVTFIPNVNDASQVNHTEQPKPQPPPSGVHYKPVEQRISIENDVVSTDQVIIKTQEANGPSAGIDTTTLKLLLRRNTSFTPSNSEAFHIPFSWARNILMS